MHDKMKCRKNEHPAKLFGGVEKHHFVVVVGCNPDLSALTTDAAGKLDVLGHDGHALGVDGSQVGVLEQADQVRLSRLLQRQHRGRLETQVGLEVLQSNGHICQKAAVA
jgi:hypothetical protein